MCGAELYNAINGNVLEDSLQVEDGLNLIFSGGYGMFIDSGLELGMDEPMATICHECTIKILDLFPAAFREEFKGSVHMHTNYCGYNYVASESVNNG